MSDNMQTEEETPEMFARSMGQVINHVALGSAISIGHRLGLFKVMIEFTEPKTSAEIAAKAGLNERYVREWLGIMVTGKMFTIKKEDTSYFLPRSRVPYFKDAVGRLLFEEFAVMFPKIEPELEDCFKQGGGIPYSSYADFHQVMNDMSAQYHYQNLLTGFLPKMEGLIEKMENGITCLDIGCGMGVPTLILAERFPKSQFYGFDFEESALKTAKEKATAKELKNAHFLARDCGVFHSEFAEKFDFITAFDAIHDQAYPAKALSAIYQMLKPDGIFSMVDVNAHSHPADNIGMPQAMLKYTISLFHCMPVSLFFKDGAGLGTCWGKELAVQMLKDAGFADIQIKDYLGDFNVHYIVKK